MIRSCDDDYFFLRKSDRGIEYLASMKTDCGQEPGGGGWRVTASTIRRVIAAATDEDLSAAASAEQRCEDERLMPLTTKHDRQALRQRHPRRWYRHIVQFSALLGIMLGERGVVIVGHAETTGQKCRRGGNGFFILMSRLGRFRCSPHSVHPGELPQIRPEMQ